MNEDGQRVDKSKVPLAMSTQPPPIPHTLARESAETGSPLHSGPTPQHVEQIATAKRLGKKIRRVTSVATIDAWTVAVFAGLTLLTGFMSFPAVALGSGMGFVAMLEFRTVEQLKRLNPKAPARLARNQLILGAFLFIYAAWNLFQSYHNAGNDISSQIGNDPQLRQMLGGVDDLAKTIMVALYGSLMVIALVGPGLTALYYWSCAPHIKRYVEQTPAWILDLQRAGMSL